MNPKPTTIFFGTSHYAVMVLDALAQAGYIPALVVTTPDRPAGKYLELTPPPIKKYAAEKNLPLAQPEKLKDPELIQTIKNSNADVSIVVAYGKIIPAEVIDIPKYKTLNLHASLLPKLRGSSPIETAILKDVKNTGVTIMRIDAEMDHGPILAQKEIVVEPWPPTARELGNILVSQGTELLIDTLPKYLRGEIKETAQDHSQATYTRMIEKKDGEIDFSKDAYENFRKIQAYADWPKTFFFVQKGDKKIRVIIKQAAYDAATNTLTIQTIIPEGKKEIRYEDFKRSLT